MSAYVCLLCSVRGGCPSKYFRCLTLSLLCQGRLSVKIFQVFAIDRCLLKAQVENVFCTCIGDRCYDNAHVENVLGLFCIDRYQQTCLFQKYLPVLSIVHIDAQQLSLFHFYLPVSFIVHIYMQHLCPTAVGG
jgi:hypothetical protein